KEGFGAIIILQRVHRSRPRSLGTMRRSTVHRRQNKAFPITLRPCHSSGFPTRHNVSSLGPRGHLSLRALLVKSRTGARCRARGSPSRATGEQAGSVAVRNRTGLHACSRLPVFRRAVMTMGSNFPIAVLPGIVTELGRVFELLLRNIRAESAKRLVVSQDAPGN